jgi:hypothetical protein
MRSISSSYIHYVSNNTTQLYNPQGILVLEIPEVLDIHLGSNRFYSYKKNWVKFNNQTSLLDEMSYAGLPISGNILSYSWNKVINMNNNSQNILTASDTLIFTGNLYFSDSVFYTFASNTLKKYSIQDNHIAVTRKYTLGSDPKSV